MHSTNDLIVCITFIITTNSAHITNKGNYGYRKYVVLFLSPPPSPKIFITNWASFKRNSALIFAYELSHLSWGSGLLHTILQAPTPKKKNSTFLNTKHTSFITNSASIPKIEAYPKTWGYQKMHFLKLLPPPSTPLPL